MKRFLKATLSFTLLTIVIVGGYFAYLKFNPQSQKTPISIVPEDAIFMIETSDITKAWNEIAKSQLWGNLIINKNFEDYNNDMLYADSLLTNNKILNILFRNRPVLISAHMISGVDYDFVFIIDIHEAAKFAEQLGRVQVSGYNINSKKYKGSSLFEFADKESEEKIYFTIIDNLLVASFSNYLLEDVIIQKDVNYWEQNSDFQKVAEEISKQKLFRFYFNYSRLAKFTRKFFPEEDAFAYMLGSNLKYSAFNAEFIDNALSLNGYTLLNKKTPSYINAFSSVSAGKFRAYELLPYNTAVYANISFQSFDQLYKTLTNEFSVQDAKDYKSFSRMLNQIENQLQINLENDFFSWIGNEIAFAKTNPKTEQRNEEIIILFHTNSISDAKEKMKHLQKQIQEYAPIKFSKRIYKNYEINKINSKGLFGILFGKLFESLEKPYYSFIEDYVVFSNSEKALIDLINHYVKGNTLAHKDEFLKFKLDFLNKSNMSVFVQTPYMYKQIYQNSNKQFKKQLQENRELFFSFSQIGTQLTNDGDFVHTKLLAKYNPDALLQIELDDLETVAAEDLFNEYIENQEFRPIVKKNDVRKKGICKIKNDNNIIIAEGNIKNQKLHGLWRTYYPSGNIKSSVNYLMNDVDGEATFYYDKSENTLKVECFFDENQIDGIYKEYFKNENRKVILNYRNGFLSGDAQFFYNNGILKIKGNYKKNKKAGKWQYYRENGEIYDNVRWKKGLKK